MTGRDITYKADEYARTKRGAPFRDAVEFHTIFSMIGNPAGLRVLDAGCGDGIYARELINRGATHVLGVDCAEDFIKMAREKNKGYEGKIDYSRAFVQDFHGIGNRDLAVGSYILSYPRNLEEAIAFCQALASHLKPGGRFIGFNNNPFEVFDGERHAQYGFRKVMTGGEEGREVIYWVGGMTNPIVNFYLRPETYERAFREAGFSTFSFQRAILSPSEAQNPYWNDFFKGEPPLIAMLAEKKS